MTRPQDSTALEYCRIEGPAVLPALEFQTFEFPLILRAAGQLPGTPGTLHLGDLGQIRLLHFAPGRFLAPSPQSSLIQVLDDLQADGVGVVFDVEGKWHAYRMTGRGSERFLASTIDVSRALRNRDCAAVPLFDCSAIVAGRPGGFDVWVEASYSRAFKERADQCLSSLWEFARQSEPS